MQPEVICLGAVNLDLVYRVDDLADLLGRWGTGLQPGGEEALTRADEARLGDLLAGYGPPAARSGGGQAANTAGALARLGVPTAPVDGWGRMRTATFWHSLAGVNLDYLVQAESGRPYPGDPRRTHHPGGPNTNDDLREGDLLWPVLAGAGLFTSLLCGRRPGGAAASSGPAAARPPSHPGPR
jgi:hypothetical protein